MHAAPATMDTEQPQQARSRMWAFALGALAVTQLFAFWMVCSTQVRRAEVRSNEMAVQQMALSDCLQYIPGSTIASCSSQLTTAKVGGPPAPDTSVTGATPVSYSYH